MGALLVDYNRSSVTVFASKSTRTRTRTNDDTDYTDGQYDGINYHANDDNASESATKIVDDQHHNRNQHKNPSSLSSLLLQLNDGNYVPQVGLGVALTGSKTYNAVSFAL